MSDSKYACKSTSDEYEIQHFDFSSTQFISDFKESIIFTIESVHKDMESCIIRKLKLDGKSQEKLRSEIKTLTEKYKTVTEVVLAKNEKIIQTFFQIPRYILLDSDIVHEETVDIDENGLLGEIEDLQKQYVKEKSLSCLYEAEIKHIDSIVELQQQLSKLIKQSNVLCKDFKKHINSLKNLNQLYEHFISTYKDIGYLV